MSSLKSDLKQAASKLFGLLGVKVEKLKIEVDGDDLPADLSAGAASYAEVATKAESAKAGASAEAGATVNVQIPEEDSGLLIGYHGDTLTSIQYLLAQIVNKGKENWTRVAVNLNDYRRSRELQLKQMAQNAADRAVGTGDEIEMPFLTPAERRIIHLELSSRPDIATYSEGEDRYRRLIVAPKKTNPEKSA